MPAAVAVWTCRRCGSTERRKARAGATQSSRSTGCAECHRRATRDRNRRYPGLTVDESRLFTRLLSDDFEDVEVTPAARGYLAAFTAHIKARSDGDHRAMRAAQAARRAALAALEGPARSAPTAEEAVHGTA